MESLLQDLRYGARQLWRSPAFTAAAIATLALGIGANSALFTLWRGIVTQPLAGVLESDQLVWVHPARAYGAGRPERMSYDDYMRYRQELSPLLQLAASADPRFAVGGDVPEEVRGQMVSGNYFAVLRTPFALGRGILPGEDTSAAASVAVIGFDYWQRRYSGDSAVLGRTIVVNGAPLTIVGVTADGFNGSDLELPRQIWVPFSLADTTAAESGYHWRNTRPLSPIGRLKPGVTLAQVVPAARTIASRLLQEDTTRGRDWGARVDPAVSGLPPGAMRQVAPVAILGAAVTAIVLLIACANVSNLLLARGVFRRREISVRLSLGASRARMTRQLLTESLLLAGLAASAGVLLAYWATSLLLSSGVLPLRFDVAPDAQIIGFNVAAVALATIAFGLLPALESTRGDIAAAVKEGAQSRSPRRSRLQNFLVVSQVALSLAMLTTAALFLRSMQKANAVDIGFEASSRVVGMSINLGLQRYSDERAAVFVDRLTERAMAAPGVERVSFTDVQPLGNRLKTVSLIVEGDQRGGRHDTQMSTVRPGYFQTLGMRLVRGRDFQTTDVPAAPSVVVVSEATAKRFWPNASAIGQRVKISERSPWLTIVGVVSDVMLAGPTESLLPVMYVAHTQDPSIKQVTLLARTSGDVGALTDYLRGEIKALDPNLPITDVHTLAEFKEIKLAPRMNGARILGGFGGLALLLACVGVYGLMAFTVLQRTREIGIRMALGAKRSDVLGLFVGRGMRLTAVGVAIGVVLSLAMSRLMQGMLYGLTPTDAATFAGVAALLAGVALLACWLPARRAATVDPAIALRTD